jgi:cysteinyl-tRNA synthetase
MAAKKQLTKKQMQDRMDKFRRLYKGLAETNRRFEQTINDLKSALATALANNTNCQKALDLNKTMLRQMSEEHGKKEQELIKLLTQLKAKLREMGYDGNFDNLGNEDD